MQCSKTSRPEKFSALCDGTIEPSRDECKHGSRRLIAVDANQDVSVLRAHSGEILVVFLDSLPDGSLCVICSLHESRRHFCAWWRVRHQMIDRTGHCEHTITSELRQNTRMNGSMHLDQSDGRQRERRAIRRALPAAQTCRLPHQQPPGHPPALSCGENHPAENLGSCNL